MEDVDLKPCPFCDDGHTIAAVARGGVWTEVEYLLNNPVPNDATKLETLRRMIAEARASSRAQDRRADGWISVSERLPKDDNEVWIARANGHVCQGWYVGGDQWCDEEDVVRTDVTH